MADGYDLMVRRKRLGLRQRDLAALIGISRPGDISDLETGISDRLRPLVEAALAELEAQRETAGAK